MSGSKKKTPAEELIESLLKDVGGTLPSDDEFSEPEESHTSTSIEGIVNQGDDEQGGFMLSPDSLEYSDKDEEEFEATRNVGGGTAINLNFSVNDDDANLPAAMGALLHESKQAMPREIESKIESNPQELKGQVVLDEPKPSESLEFAQPTSENNGDATQRISVNNSTQKMSGGDSEKTVAVAGYQVSTENDYEDRVKVSVGQNRSGYSTWNSGGSADSNLAQAENLRIAQEKILDLEQENEKLRIQNEQLMAASEIIKERSDLLSAQISEYKKDRDGLEESFKNEVVLLKNHLARKDTELQRSKFKADELESRLKFDMKKIRIRERELENRLELVRAEKNAIVKSKDEQILDLRRKMDQLQMEVESYRQKCIDLNKLIETNQESFKRTTRALRLAMANLELQEENKSPLKKVD